MRRYLPRTVTGQVVALTVVSALMAQAIGGAVFWIYQPGADLRTPVEFDTRVATMASLLGRTPQAKRDELIAIMRQAAPELDAALSPTLLDGEPDIGRISEKLHPGFVVSFRLGRVQVRLPDGAVFSIVRPPMEHPPAGPFLLALLSLAGGVLLFGTWAARAVTQPLRRLAARLDTASVGAADQGNANPVDLDGPIEVQAVAAAVQRRNARIAGLLADNARTLAAVGHDLRTPLTRLRLRADLMEEPELRAEFVRDLDHMSALTEAALEYLRGRRAPEPPVRVDLGSLVSTVVDQFDDLDADVSAAVSAGTEAVASPNALQRALRNLVENAVRHAGRAAIEVRLEPGRAYLIVRDDGPGIPAEDRERLMQPFERGDSARGASGEHGLGLGLSIAREVAEAHGGRLILGGNHPAGLVATIEIPQPPMMA